MLHNELTAQCALVMLIMLAFMPLCASTASGDSTQSNAVRTLLDAGFEDDSDSVTRWVEQGEITVNYAGPSEERAFKGKRSYKIDVTLISGTWTYWQSKSLAIPFYGSPFVRGALHVEPGDANVSLGYSYASPENAVNGMVGHCTRTKTHPSGWTEWEAKTARSAADTDHVESIALYIFGKPGDRIIVYVDELSVSGSLPPDYESTLKAEISSIETRRHVEYDAFINRLSADLGKLRPLPSSSTDPASPWLDMIALQLNEYCAKNLPILKSECDRLKTQRGSTGDLSSLQSKIRILALAADSYRKMPAYVKKHANTPYLTYIVPPTRDEKVLPDSFPVPGIIGDSLSVTACPDEYEPASFVIQADNELKNVNVSVSKFTSSGNSKITPTADIFAVKCWWQSGRDFGDLTHPLITPELLLKDSSLVQLDNVNKRNKVRNPYAPQDAKELQPVTIPAGTNQQFWINVHVPPGTAPGLYKGTLKISIDNAPGMDMPFAVKVLPFNLEQPILEYGIYYRGVLSDEEWTEKELRSGTDAKSERQYRAELLDMKAHGIQHPSCYTRVDITKSGSLDFTNLKQTFNLRKQLGMSKGPILQMEHGLNIWEYAHEKDAEKRKVILEEIAARTKAWMSFVKETGYPTPLFYGVDEADPEILKMERPAYQAIKESGGSCGVAVSPVFLDLVGEYLDRPVVPVGLSKPVLDSQHALGHKVWVYANPIVSVEDPETYRRNYGLAVWKSGCDGVCPYVYQQRPDGEPWDDFDNTSERALNMAYPTIDGVVSTIQWEGFREGYDDVRYLSTLLKYISVAKNKKANQEALAAEKWLSNLDISGDLDVVRQEIIKRIMKLKQLTAK